MCMIDDGERAKVWSESTRIARKATHHCCECGRAIEVGELYHYVFGVGDGDRFYAKWCGHCNVAKEWLWENCSGSILESVIEDVREHVDSYRGRAVCVPRLQRLVLGAQREWRIKFGPHVGELMPIPSQPAALESLKRAA